MYNETGRKLLLPSSSFPVLGSVGLPWILLTYLLTYSMVQDIIQNIIHRSFL